MKNVISTTFSVTAIIEGKDAYILDLTNQMDAVPVDANGNVTFATTISTVARIIKGADYVRDNIGVPQASALKIGDVTPTVVNNGGLVTIEWKFTTAHRLPLERYAVVVQMTHDGKNYSADFVLRMEKSGAIYQLLPSMSEVPFVRDADYNLIPAKQTLYCGYTKNQNGNITSYAGKSAEQLQNIDGKYSIFYRPVNADGTYGQWAWMKDLSGFGISISNTSNYAAYEFALSSAQSYSAVADSNIIDRETVPIVRQSERGFSIVTSVPRDNFTEAQWATYGDIGHAESWTGTSSIRNGARIGDLFLVVGKATDTGNGHTATYRCTNGSGDLAGVCIAHQISRAAERRATVMLYKRSAVALPSTNKPTGTLTYNFSTGKLTGTGFNNWTQEIPALGNGESLYVIAATAYSLTDTDDIAANEWSDPVLYNQNGMNTASVFLYQRSASSPAKPTSTLTYKFSTGLLSGNLNGWSQTVPGSNGNPCWVIQATAISTAETDDITASEWSTPQKYAVDGDSPIIIDLDNEMDAVPCDSDGKVSVATTIVTTATLFKGASVVNSGMTAPVAANIRLVGVTPSVSQLSNGSYRISWTFYAGTSISGDRMTAEITIGYGGNNYSQVFTVNVVKSGKPGTSPTVYQLLPSMSSIAVGRNTDGSYNPATVSITCGYTKTVGSSTPSTVTDATSSFDGYNIYFRLYNRSTGVATVYYRYSVYKSIYLTNFNVSTYKKIEFIICTNTGDTMSGDSSITGIVDRETVPVVADGVKGDKGEDGDPGNDGNGISSVVLHRMFTQSFEAPEPNVSGWIVSTASNYPTESGLTQENRYLWQKKTTNYTKSTVQPTVEIYIVAQFDSGIKENLLEDTAFLSEGQMEAWERRTGSISLNAVGNHNSFGMTPVWADQVTEMLQQCVYKYGEIQKLKPNTWYTLSFYAAMQSYQDLLTTSVYNGDDGGSLWEINSSKRGFWLTSGQTAIITVTGRCYSTSAYLRVYAYDDDWTSGQSVSVEFKNTYSETKSFKITNTSGKALHFNVEGYVYLPNGSQNTYSDLNHRCYVSLIRIDRGCMMHSYLYRSDNGQAVLASASAPWYVDGKKFTAAATMNDGNNRIVSLHDGTTANVQTGTLVQFGQDGCVKWQLSPTVKRHSVTFKTPSSLSSIAEYRVLFRLSEASHYGWVSMPKLEENTIATEWIENTNDRMADDFQHVYVGKWVSGTTYHYDSGVRHVVRAKKSVLGAMTYFRMKKRTTTAGYNSTIEPYNDTANWEAADYLKFVATDFLLADEAIITFAKTNRIIVTNDSGTVAAGMGGAEGGNNDYPLWVGATYENRANAPFRVSLTGKMYATDAEVNGVIKVSLLYGTSMNVTASMTINPKTNPAKCYIFDGGPDKTITLPDPQDYGGLELQFFYPVFTRAVTGKMRISGSIMNPNSNDFYESVSSLEIPANKCLTVKSLPFSAGYNRWFVIVTT